MRILIAPDKFKGSLKAMEAAEAIRDGFARVFPDAHYELAPIADGGEGTAAVFLHSMSGEEVEVPAHDALGRPISAKYTWFRDKQLAVIEMSEASGLWRFKPSELKPLQATTFGTGELMADAIKRGAETILVALGGSATNDAGVGMATALGWKFLDATDNEMDPRPGNFAMIQTIVPPADRSPCRITALCDVNNPLLGPNGATYVYGPQKGATKTQLETLEAGLTHVADLCRDHLYLDFRDTAGAGATGGLAFGLMTFCDATIEMGFDTVSELLDLKGKTLDVDFVITGEGRLDAQSLQGKGPAEVAKLARLHGRPVIAFAGEILGPLEGFDVCIPISNGAMTLEQSQARAAELLRDAAERTARLIKISL
ncbi:MAG: glycerate kinase [Terrimicrobiaceae bacterium]